jgi:hypothetical protein
MNKARLRQSYSKHLKRIMNEVDRAFNSFTGFYKFNEEGD